MLLGAGGSVFSTIIIVISWAKVPPPHLPILSLFLILAALTTLLSTSWFDATPPSSSSNKPLVTLMDNVPFATGIDANVLLVFDALSVAGFRLMAMSISLPIPFGLFTTTIVICALRGLFCGEALDSVHLTNVIGPSGLAIIGGACFVGAVTQTFSSVIMMIELTDNIQ